MWLSAVWNSPGGQVSHRRFALDVGCAATNLPEGQTDQSKQAPAK